MKKQKPEQKKRYALNRCRVCGKTVSGGLIFKPSIAPQDSTHDCQAISKYCNDPTAKVKPIVETIAVSDSPFNTDYQRMQDEAGKIYYIDKNGSKYDHWS